MPITATSAVMEMLSRDSRLFAPAAETVSYLMDLLYYGEFAIFEQVSSGGAHERVNLIGSKGGERAYGQAPLWLLSCMNTSTDPTPNRWASTEGLPLGARRPLGSRSIYGLGANSGKVDLALKILAASRFHASELKRPLFLAALSGEEARGSGIHALLANSAPQGGLALIGAPTNLEVWRDHPGCIAIKLTLNRHLRHRRMPPCRGFFEVQVVGASAHAQMNGLGTDAITRGHDLLKRLRKHGDIRLLAFSAGDTANRTAGACTIRVATSFDALPPLPPWARGTEIADGTALPFPIDAMFKAWIKARDAGLAAVSDALGTHRNVRAARTSRSHHTGSIISERNAITGDVMLWTGPGADTVEICEAFAEAVQRKLIGVEEIAVDIAVVQDRAALSGTEMSSKTLRLAKGCLERVDLPPVISGGPLTTDAALLRAAGMKTIVFGPGRGPGDLYRDDEHIPVRHLEKALAFYQQIIQRWCVEGEDC